MTVEQFLARPTSRRVPEMQALITEIYTVRRKFNAAEPCNA